MSGAPNSAIERAYVAQGYAPPAGMTWFDVAAHRAKWDIDPIMVPVAHTPGACIGWGTPMIDGEYLKRPPKAFDYSHWRHGGWYVHDTQWPNGGCGCVAKLANGKWAIACDPRDDPPTFRTRDEAALAEWLMVLAMPAEKVMEA